LEVSFLWLLLPETLKLDNPLEILIALIHKDDPLKEAFGTCPHKLIDFHKAPFHIFRPWYAFLIDIDPFTKQLVILAQLLNLYITCLVLPYFVVEELPQLAILEVVGGQQLWDVDGKLSGAVLTQKSRELWQEQVLVERAAWVCAWWQRAVQG
jgi:hypothetical protein